MDLKEENAIGGDPHRHWYYIAKGRAIKSMLGDAPLGTLLDVGAGSGVFSKMLVSENRAERAVCVDLNYDDAFMAARSTDKINFTRAAAATDADTVIMIDVVEHVDDDIGLIADYASSAKPGARFLISVPAFQALWSPHDDYLEHKRRYTRASLRDAVKKAGLEPIELRYFFGLLFPAVAAMRIAAQATHRADDTPSSQMREVPGWMNTALIALHDVERATLFPINRLAGVSCFCLAQKPSALEPARAAA